MSWRKWFVRGLVFGVLALAAAAYYVYQHWTDPAVVRGEVLAHLEQFFPGASVSLGDAHLRILGGIRLGELHLARRDDGSDIFHAPSALLYHDKERLLDGDLKVCKIELDRPRFHFFRNASGCWSTEGLVAPAQAGQPIPTLVIHQGTFVLEDRLGTQTFPPVEIGQVNLTLVNDPAPTVAIDGRAHSPVLGEVEIHGTWTRESRALAISAQVQGLDVTPTLVQRIGGFCPDAKLQGLHLEGKADIKADLAFVPESTDPLSFDIRCRFSHGKLRHPQVPLPLNEISATVRVSNGHISLEKMQARSGPAHISAHGALLPPCPAKNFEGHVEIKHLHICDELFDRLPEKFRTMRDAFAPCGSATLRADCAQRDGQWTPLASGAPSTISLLPEDMRICFFRFAYPLERTRGALDWNLHTSRIGVDVIAHAGAQPITIRGTWQGNGPQADAAIDIQGSDIPLDETLLNALRPSGYDKLARSFNATGRGDIKAHIRHVPGSPKFANDYHVFFHHAAIQWEQFPYHLSDVTGYLDVYPEHWEFREFEGKHQGGVVRVQGRTQSRGAENQRSDWLTIRIGGRHVPVDKDLKNAFQPLPSLTRAWETFQPAGAIEFQAVLQRPLATKGPDAEARIQQEMDVQAEARGCSMQPRFFPVHLSDVAGQLHYHDNRLELVNLQASHGDAQLALRTAHVNLMPGGAFFADLKDLQARNFLLDSDVIQALPDGLKSGVRAVALTGPVRLLTDLKVGVGSQPGSRPDIYWDGKAWLDHAQLRTGIDLTAVKGELASRGRYWRPNIDGRQLLALNGNFHLDQAITLKQPLRDVIGNFQVQELNPDVLTLGMKAPLFGGDLSGEARVEFGPRLRYEVNLTASQIDLHQFGQHNLGPSAQITGTAVGRLYLTGQGDGLDALDGNGRIDVPRGHLYNLPLLLDLLKFLGLRWPDRTMFDEVHALFNIHGHRVHVSRLELLGNAISLYGNGDFRIDGSDTKLDFYPSWGRLEQLVPPSLRYIPAELGKKVLKIEMRGKVGGEPGDLKFTKKPIPVLFDPLLNVRDRLVGSKENEKRLKDLTDTGRSN